MPWVGFFNKIARADLWIVLDHVENNPRDAAFWCRRVRVLDNGILKWVSVPLQKPDKPGVIGVPINKMIIERGLAQNMKKCRDTIFRAYANSQYYGQISQLVEQYFFSDDDSLLNSNMAFILNMLKLLQIDTEIVHSCSLAPQGSSNELLIDLLCKTSATTYLCGGGAKSYQIDEMFFERGISVRTNEFDHPVYDQPGAQDFVPGLSVIDMISRIGLDKTSKWLNVN